MLLQSGGADCTAWLEYRFRRRVSQPVKLGFLQSDPLEAPQTSPIGGSAYAIQLETRGSDQLPDRFADWMTECRFDLRQKMLDPARRPVRLPFLISGRGRPRYPLLGNSGERGFSCQLPEVPLWQMLERY